MLARQRLVHAKIAYHTASEATAASTGSAMRQNFRVRHHGGRS